MKRFPRSERTDRRGAAKVSVVWMIVALVAFLIAAVMFFLTSQEHTHQSERAAALDTKRKELETRNEELIRDYQKLSEVVGYYDETAAGAKTDVATAQDGLKALSAAFPDIDPSVKTFQRAAPIVMQAYSAAKARIKDLETANAGLQAETETLSKSIREQGESSSKELASLRSQLADAQQAQSDMRTDLERQLAEARDQYKDRDAKWRTSQSELEANSRKYAQEALAMRTRMDEQGRKLNPFIKEPEAADGRILGVSKDLGMGWINLGARNRLAIGTRFSVVSGAHTSKQVKAMAEVTRVEGDMAEVRFYDQRDPYDSPIAGDVIFNPLFDPSGERHALLVGSFNGAFNDKAVRLLLGDMGIQVQKTLDKSTDFLIVGSDKYTDENGQVLADAQSPTDLPVYKDAVAQGVQVIQLKDLRQYFRF